MRPRILLALILVVYLVLGVIYSLATPPLEASDEFKHYPFVQYVQTHHDLPVLDPQTCLESPDDCPWLQDGGQPPAYYVLMAAATSWIDTSDLEEVRWMNWHAFIGNPSQVCNKNLIVHLPERERFPWHGAVLAIHLIRLLTLGLGAGTILLTHALARDLFPERPTVALGAAALTAFNPMFLFVSSAVNNDALAAVLGCLTLLLVVRLVRDGLRGPVSAWRYATLGLVIGLFLLTKLSGLAALILLAPLLAWVSYRRRSLRPLLLGLTIIVALAMAISGWWFARNVRLYGDPTGLDPFITIQGEREAAPNVDDWVDEFVSFRWTYWGLFGAVDVMAPGWVYVFFDALSLVALAGLLVWAVRSRHGGLWWIPLLWAGVLFVSVLRWVWIYFSFQGRLLFPGIAGISTLMVLGLEQWVPAGRRAVLVTGLSLFLLVLAAAIPFVSIIPAYEQPQPLSLADVPTQARVEPVDLAGVARIVGWELSPQSVRRDGNVEVVVYWQALAPDDTDYISFARLLGRDHELVGQVNRFPACGMVPTSRWRPGQVWRDPYRVPVAEDASVPSRLLLEVGLYEPQEDRTLGVVQVGQARLAAAGPAPRAPQPLVVPLADGLSLLGYDLSPATVRAGEVVTLTLYWESQAVPSRDYTVFVHLLDGTGRAVLFGDGPPLGGYYPTGMWGAGEVVADPHPLALPTDLAPGVYRVMVGMYDLDTMARLVRPDGGGDSIELPATLTVR